MFNILKIRSFKHCHNKLFFVNLMLLVYDMRLVSSFQNVSVAMHHILFMITRAVWEATNNLTKIRGVS